MLSLRIDVFETIAVLLFLAQNATHITNDAPSSSEKSSTPPAPPQQDLLPPRPHHPRCQVALGTVSSSLFHPLPKRRRTSGGVSLRPRSNSGSSLAVGVHRRRHANMTKHGDYRPRGTVQNRQKMCRIANTEANLRVAYAKTVQVTT